MYIFNAFQFMCMFVGMPYLIGWLNTNPFAYSVAAFWLALIVFFIMFIATTASVAHSIREIWK